jgi:DNA mismatch repair protein MutS
MMIQYKKIKEQHKDAVLFFRLGDFYEMFEDDAREISSLLDLTLTQRNGVPMCGIPYHAGAGYIARLIKAGKKIAVCEQTSVPRPGKGIVTREIVEIITPGTLVDESLLDRTHNNYLVALARVRESIALASIDLSTADFAATRFPYDRAEEPLKRELYRLDPKEIIVEESLLASDPLVGRLLGERDNLVINRYPSWSFDLDANYERLKRNLGVTNLRGFGLGNEAPEVAAAGIILSYVEDTAKTLLPHIRDLRVYAENSFLLLDESTQKNLELVKNLQDGSRRFTLLEVLNHTKTAMGARRLHSWILTPLLDVAAIRERQESVAFFHKHQLVLSKVRELLGRTLDMERLGTRVAMDRAHAKDLVSLAQSLDSFFEVAAALAGTELPPLLARLAGKDRRPLAEAAALIRRAILDEPSLLLTEGELIRPGYDAELDRLREIRDHTQEVLERSLAAEKEKTGIASLKLRYNRIIGYYYEVTKANRELVPDYFIRRQSLVGGERFTTQELIDREEEMNDAAQKIVDIERELFLKVRAAVKAVTAALMEAAREAAVLDVLQSFAYAATLYGYTCPRVENHQRLEIREGRHPVVEANLPGGAFVPNTVSLDTQKRSFIILTGPNMAGKSTYLRQTALITLLAQIGSFVPAESAEIGVVDKIFCRVGASDNLARGESTFLIEMNETAHILRQATERSLIVMDEVGRGTSTTDGLAIAWAVTLYILERVRAKTLFATHFHELTRIEHEKLANFSLEVVEKDGTIVFLKKIKPGPADSSYGVHVAQLAGIPDEVIKTARRLQRSAGAYARESAAAAAPQALDAPVSQPTLFSQSEMVLEAIKGLAIDSLRPLDALTLLARFKEELLTEEAGGLTGAARETGGARKTSRQKTIRDSEE